jgi:hypothetical protein
MQPIKTYPAFDVYPLVEGHNIELHQEAGRVAPTALVDLRIRAFPGDKYEFLRSFTIGADAKGEHPWAFGNASILSSTPTRKGTALGCDLGDLITIEGKQYKVLPDHNHNIKFEAAA